MQKETDEQTFNMDGQIAARFVLLSMKQIVKMNYKERYIVRINDTIVPLQTSDIAFIYSEEKENYIMTFDGYRYIINSSLDIIGKEFDPKNFFRISRSCIVSMNAIVSIVKLAGGRLKIISRPKAPFEMTVSRSRVERFLAWIER